MPAVLRQLPSWVLTRLHARYGKETLTEDLVFREAKPVVGGRANCDGTNGDEGARGQTDGGVNNFQGRYIIRHYWTGPVACENPLCGSWGGPPRQPVGGADADGRQAGCATAPRGKIVLKPEVRSPRAAARHRAARRAPRADEAEVTDGGSRRPSQRDRQSREEP